jgi:hypothetical protein
MHCVRCRRRWGSKTDNGRRPRRGLTRSRHADDRKNLRHSVAAKLSMHPRPGNSARTSVRHNIQTNAAARACRLYVLIINLLDLAGYFSRTNNSIYDPSSDYHLRLRRNTHTWREYRRVLSRGREHGRRSEYGIHIDPNRDAKDNERRAKEL